MKRNMGLADRLARVGLAVVVAGLILTRQLSAAVPTRGEKPMAADIVREKILSGARIIDVRSPAEFQDGAYPGAVNIPLPVLPLRLRELEPRDKPIVLYCESGTRSGHAERLLRKAGFADVINAGGLEDMPR